MSKPTVPTKTKAPTDDNATRDELRAVANGLGLLVAITSGAVVATPEEGLQFADTAAGAALKSALCPAQPAMLLPDR
ncbi:MAG TPA: hypothetical protein VGE74_32870 [Gemmata sp.]